MLLFYSGLGGLTVFREIVKQRPDLHYLYLADDARFPYGALAGDEVIARVCEVVGAAIAREHPDCVVIACNTASTLVLPHLRAAHALPFVGHGAGDQARGCALAHATHRRARDAGHGAARLYA